MGKMRVEKAKSHGTANDRYSAASSVPQFAAGATPSTDNTAFDFGPNRASNAHPRYSNPQKRRRRKEFSWMGILRVKIANMFGGVHDVLPEPSEPLPPNQLHIVPRPTSHAQSVM